MKRLDLHGIAQNGVLTYFGKFGKMGFVKDGNRRTAEVEKMQEETKAMRIFKAIADKTSWIYVIGPNKFQDEIRSLRTIQKLAREFVKDHAGQSETLTDSTQ